MLKWNLTGKDLKGYAMRHKFARFIRIKNNSRNFESRRERTEERPPVYLTWIAGVPLHIAHQTASLSLAQFLQVFAVLIQQRGRASNILARLRYSVNDRKIFPQKRADKIKCIPKKDELSAASCSWFLLFKRDRKPSLTRESQSTYFHHDTRQRSSRRKLITSLS